MRRLIRQLIFWLRGYRTVEPKHTPDIKKKSSKEGVNQKTGETDES